MPDCTSPWQTPPASSQESNLDEISQDLRRAKSSAIQVGATTPNTPPPLSRPRAPCSVSRMLPDAGAEARAQCSGPRQQAGTLCLPIPVRRTACTSKPAPCLQEPGSRPQTECPPHGVAVVDDQEGKMGLRNALLLLGLLRHKAEEGKSERNTRHTGIGTESKGYPSWGGKERQGKEELCPHVPCSWSAFVSWHQLL